MKQTFMIAVALLLTLSVTPVFAAEGVEKGASAKAYEHASEQSIFIRVNDWFATIGKSPEEKASILQERKTERARKREERQIREVQREKKRLRMRQTSEDRQMENTTRSRNRTENRVRTGGGSGGRGKR